jgi:uncharacterized protein (TIGR03067 family)
MMRLCGVLLAAGAVLALAADEKKDDAKDELKKFDGTWVLVSSEKDGEKAPEEALKKVMPKAVSKDGTVTFFSDGKEQGQATFTVDPTKKPKTMDATMTTGPDKGKKSLGIYEMEGDTLKICYNEKERPKEFSAKKGSGNTLDTYKREKK